MGRCRFVEASHIATIRLSHDVATWAHPRIPAHARGDVDARQGASTQLMLPVLGVLVTMRDALVNLGIGSALDVLRALLEA